MDKNAIVQIIESTGYLSIEHTHSIMTSLGTYTKSQPFFERDLEAYYKVTPAHLKRSIIAVDTYILMKKVTQSNMHPLEIELAWVAKHRLNGNISEESVDKYIELIYELGDQSVVPPSFCAFANHIFNDYGIINPDVPPILDGSESVDFYQLTFEIIQSNSNSWNIKSLWLWWVDRLSQISTNHSNEQLYECVQRHLTDVFSG